jgi:hypothetical protein
MNLFFKRAVLCTLVVMLGLSLVPGRPVISVVPEAEAAADNPALILVEITSAAVILTEGVHLLVTGLQKKKKKDLMLKKKQEQELMAKYNGYFKDVEGAVTETNRTVFSNTSGMITNTMAVTNRAAQETNLLALVRALTNVQHEQSLTNAPVLVPQMNEKTNNYAMAPAIFSNLTESEKQDLELFGKDYYYLVSLAYYKVGKADKSREFMFHSLAIGMRAEEGTRFLKEKFGLTDNDIIQGVRRYYNSR